MIETTAMVTRIERIAVCRFCNRSLSACLILPCETMAPAHETLKRFEQSLLDVERPLSLWAYFDRLRAFIEAERTTGGQAP